MRTGSESRNPAHNVLRHATCMIPLILLALYPGRAGAQISFSPPEISMKDSNRVDLMQADASIPITFGSIGAGDLKLDYSEAVGIGGIVTTAFNAASFAQDDISLSEYLNINVDMASQQFVDLYGTSGSYSLKRGRYATVQIAPDRSMVLYTKVDGTTYKFIDIPGLPYVSDQLRLSQIRKPNGITIDFTWQRSGLNTRPVSISNNAGYRIEFTYQYDGDSANDLARWMFVKDVKFINTAYSGTQLSSATRNLTSVALGPFGQYDYEYSVVTDGGAIWKIQSNTSYIKVKKPSDTDYAATYTIGAGPYPGIRVVTSVTDRGVTTGYAYTASNPDALATLTISNPDATSTYATSYFRQTKVEKVVNLKSIRDENGNTVLFDMRSDYQPARITAPEGNYSTFAYDARGNLVSETAYAKPGSPAPTSIVKRSAVYPATCSNPITCNLPTQITDARGNSTDYQYDPVHGGILSETLPADASGIRPVKRYAYAQRYAWLSNGAGGYVKAAAPIWVRTEERMCRTSATVGNACAGGPADEVVTVYDYGPDAGPNNLLLRGVAVTSGTVTQRTCYTYDKLGRKLSETTPLGTGGNCP